MNVSINNVVTVSVSQVGQALSRYNTSNLAIFTHEVPGESFGELGYKLYLSPTEVGTDFGTDSKTYEMALSVFSQQPNILAGGGYLAVIEMIDEEQLIDFTATPDAGAFVANYDGNASASIAYNDNAATVQTKLRAIEGLEQVTVTGSITTTGLTVVMKGVPSDAGLITTTSNTLTASASPVTITVTEEEGGETFGPAIARTTELIEYFGCMTTYIMGETELDAAAAILQPLNKIGFVVQSDETSVADGGMFDDIAEAGNTHTRCLFYGASEDNSDPLVVQAAYAGRALSTNFDGSNTTQTMHLKDLTGVVADSTMDQTLLNLCVASGADSYPSIQGVAKVFTSGANEFFDNVYNLLWFVGDIKVTLFNILAQVGTKITQTESGVSVLKSGIQGVCEQAITNQFVAPGRWTSPTTFGNQLDFYENIIQRGYYIYSQPVAQQLPAAREDREAPVIQVAIKLAGAIHSVDVIVNVNK